MAISGSWGVQNTTPASHSLTPILIETDKDYAVVSDGTGKTVVRNVTSPQDQEEFITYQGQDLSRVVQSRRNTNPPKSEAGRSINIKLEGKKRLSSSTDDSFIVDLPVSVDLTFRYTVSQYIDSSDLLAVLYRLLGSLYDSDDSGNTRLDNLMVGQYNPNL
jgi:hypothetical protein